MFYGQITSLQVGSGPWERVRVLVPLGAGLGDVLGVFLRLRDHARLIVYRDGSVVEEAR